MTDKLIKELLSQITIIVDTRENENSHILKYFAAKGIKYIERKLDFGDYSFEIEGKSFENRIAIERKASLTELSGNLAQNRERFEAEFARAREANAKVIMMVENGSYDGILGHKYRTNLNEKSYAASIFTFRHRYNLEIEFIPEKLSGWFIYNTMKYFAREELKSMEGVA